MTTKGFLRTAITISFFALFSGASYAVIDTSELTKGFAKYQAGRVENIALDNFLTEFIE